MPDRSVSYSLLRLFLFDLLVTRAVKSQLMAKHQNSMYVCTYVCMYVRGYVCMYVCIYLSIYLCIYVCTQARMHVALVSTTTTEVTWKECSYNEGAYDPQRH